MSPSLKTIIKQQEQPRFKQCAYRVHIRGWFFRAIYRAPLVNNESRRCVKKSLLAVTNLIIWAQA
jgi:hypothetical protein